jgi:hypothetical protein
MNESVRVRAPIMSYVRFNISDRDGTTHGDLHGSITDTLIATLASEPETIPEFEFALERYIKSESDWPLLHGFRKHENLEPYDAGIVAIDLPGRTVGYETTYSIPCREGDIRISGQFGDEDEVRIPYRLPDDWMFVETMPLYEGTRIGRAEKRLEHAPFDARPVLFGRPLVTHIVRSIAEAANLDDEDLFADIHARWLMTKRDDLRGTSPRDVLFEKRDFIDFDLHTRSLAWSFTKVCPPPLPTDSFAYVNAGFGTHEWVLDYDLIRHLLNDAADRRMSGESGELEEEVTRLSKVRDEWLRSPDPESSGRTPLDIIELERRRINITATAQEILIDENCPCCVALAEDFDTPMFIHLDGCNMDDRFEFSHFKTREEWQADKDEWEKHFREYEKNREESVADEVATDRGQA